MKDPGLKDERRCCLEVIKEKYVSYYYHIPRIAYQLKLQ